MREPLDAQVSLFRGSHAPEPIATLSIGQALERIRSGQYQRHIAYLQRVLAQRGKAAYDRAKRQLHAVTFCGTFAPKRGIEHLSHHSGIVHGDLDHVLDVDATKRAIAADPRTLYVFTSPSATGLKLGVHIAPVEDDHHYKYHWQVVADAYACLYGVPWDPSGKDVSRLCYVSSDPELYVNPHAAVFDVPPAPPPEPRAHPQRGSVPDAHIDRQDYAARAIRTAVEMIQTAPMGTRHHTRLKAARLLGGYVGGGMLSYQEALSALSHALDGYTEDMGAAIATVTDGLAYGEANPITLEALEAERQAWIEAHRATPLTTHPALSDDPWAGMRTLPARPYTGFRPYIRGARTHGHR